MGFGSWGASASSGGGGGGASLSGLGSTDNAVIRANGTGGDTAQGSGVTIDDSDNVAGVGYLRVGSATNATGSGDISAGASDNYRFLWDASAGVMTLLDGAGTHEVELDVGLRRVALGSNGEATWSSGAADDTADLRLGRHGAGVLQVSDPRSPAADGAVRILDSSGSAVEVRTGSGAPEGSVTAPAGSVYLRTSAGAGTSLYVKESGTGNTGWVAYSSGAAAAAYPSTGWSWINQGSATVTEDATNGISLIIPASGSNHLHLRSRSAPSTPYTLVAELRPTLADVNTVGAGVAFREATSGEVLMAQVTRLSSAWRFRVSRWTNATTFSAESSNVPTNWRPGNSIYMRLDNDGTNLTVDYSHDSLQWVQAYTEAVGAFLTPDELCFGGEYSVSSTTGSGFDSWVLLKSWETS